MHSPSAAFRAALFPALILLAVVPAQRASAAPAFAVDAKPGVAASLAQELRGVSVNPNECFRVRNIRIVRDDLKIYLNDGYLIFSTEVAGTRIAAVFSGEIEGGDAEVLLMPPNRGERKSLAKFTDAPMLNRHFRTALFVFTDGTGDQLAAELKAENKFAPELGPSMAQAYSSVVRNIAEGFELRLLQDLLNPQRQSRGLLFATVTDRDLGNFDLIYDPSAREQLTTGRFMIRDERPVFDYWTNFESQPVRTGQRARPGRTHTLQNYRIESVLDSTLNLAVVTRAKLKILEPNVRVVGFDIADRMQVERVLVDGKPVEMYRRESLRAGAIRLGDNAYFLVVLPEAATAPVEHEIEFQHSGQVVQQSGRGVYYVGARNSWYPSAGAEFTTFDLTFTYPKNLDLVATGEVIDHKQEGETKTTRRRASAPIRFAGFNLGEYESVRVSRPPYVVEAFGNREVEAGLQPAPLPAVIAPPGPRGGRTRVFATPPPPLPLDTKGRLNALAGEVASAMEFMSGLFGPPPLKTLTVSPIPAGIGQGFPGLLYVSTMSYLNPRDLPVGLRSTALTTFYSDLLAVHEVAHQWWGNLVTSPSYQEDWLQESLANYSALLYLEKKKGPKAVEAVLESYREHLLAKDEDGAVIDSAGPISLGTRLRSSKTREAWRVITYEKGTWIMHMLRRQMGDAAFLKLLREAVSRHALKELTSAEFSKLAAELSPRGAPDPKLEVFMENWVHGTGIPELSITHTAKMSGRRLVVAGTLKQSGVGEDFEADVPVEIHYPRNVVQTHWVRSGKDPVPFEFIATQRPVKVVIGQGVLRASK